MKKIQLKQKPKNMNEVASVAINEFTLKYVTTNALKEPSIIPKPTPPRTLKRMFPVAFSILSANNGATTKIAEMEISKLPDIITIVINEAAIKIVDC